MTTSNNILSLALVRVSDYTFVGQCHWHSHSSDADRAQLFLSSSGRLVNTLSQKRDEPGQDSSDKSKVTIRTKYGFNIFVFFRHLVVASQYDGRVMLICAAKDGYKRSLVYRFLDEFSTSSSFTSLSKAIIRANDPHDLDRKLMRAVQPFQARFTDSAKVDKLGALQSDVDQAKSLVQDNVRKLQEQQDKMTAVEGRAQDLQDYSSAFRSEATAVSKEACWRRCKLQLLLIFVLVVVVVVIFML
eukprot:gnl/Dysnectes_brevis/1012_a1129_3375.p1 GENE.gnl/Dysnectes_brevis/1012_a1129_3375~~gnl/Dysnectes_brevis/1012_a1129_3375.p1  ORF type:complete len:244 (+),score=73.85 gnl/Dysnectes_brevis/1012_a1129_3375:44-775(+)